MHRTFAEQWSLSHLSLEWCALKLRGGARGDVPDGICAEPPREGEDPAPGRTSGTRGDEPIAHGSYCRPPRQTGWPRDHGIASIGDIRAPLGIHQHIQAWLSQPKGGRPSPARKQRARVCDRVDRHGHSDAGGLLHKPRRLDRDRRCCAPAIRSTRAEHRARFRPGNPRVQEGPSEWSACRRVG